MFLWSTRDQDTKLDKAVLCWYSFQNQVDTQSVWAITRIFLLQPQRQKETIHQDLHVISKYWPDHNEKYLKRPCGTCQVYGRAHWGSWNSFLFAWDSTTLTNVESRFMGHHNFRTQGDVQPQNLLIWPVRETFIVWDISFVLFLLFNYLFIWTQRKWVNYILILMSIKGTQYIMWVIIF